MTKRYQVKSYYGTVGKFWQVWDVVEDEEEAFFVTQEQAIHRALQLNEWASREAKTDKQGKS